MSLHYVRIFCRKNATSKHFRCLYTSTPSTLGVSLPTLRSCENPCETEDERNKRLKRPMSPCLSIYEVQMTSMLSISHRATGIILSSYVITLGFGTLFVPGGIPCLIDGISDWELSSAALFACKTLFAYPLTYHYFNGIRHLTWDLGKCLEMKQVIKTGWAVIGLSVIGALALAAL